MNQVIHTKTSNIKYIGSFDSLRAFATLFVLLIHGSYGVLQGGWIGVDLFFVLSGYLITTLLYNEFSTFKNISLSKFYARRALRLFPPLIICILLANLLWPISLLKPTADRFTASMAALFYFTNILKPGIAGNLPHLWSLSVEEHFYFIWPFLTLFYIFKIRLKKKISFLIILILAVTVFKILVYNYKDHLSNNIFIIDPYSFTLCRIDCILMGSLLSLLLLEPKFKYLDNSKSNNFILLTFLFSFIVILFKLNSNNLYFNNGGFIFTNLLCTFTVFVAIKSPGNFLFQSKLVSWIGKRSYGIYVYHYPIFLAFEGFRQFHSISNLLIIFSLRIIFSFALAAFSYKYIEQPILRLKKLYQPKFKFKDGYSADIDHLNPAECDH